MKTQTDPTIDYAFKHVFGREESKPALKSLLGAVLQPGGGPGIASLELLNPFNAKAAESEKTSIVDIKARDESGRQFFVEMQIVANADFLQRALYYWAGLYRDQLHQSEDYASLRPTIGICFVDSILFADLPDYHHIFDLRDRRHQRLFTDQMVLHILELPKFNKRITELTTDLDRWLFFLRHGAELDLQMVPDSLNLPAVLWAIGDLFMISRIDPERELYEAEIQARRDLSSYLRTALEQGRTEGRTEGRAEGLRLAIEALQESLGREITPREELQSLSWEELQQVLARLQADLRRR